MPRHAQLYNFTQVRSKNFTWFLQTHFMPPLLLHRGRTVLPTQYLHFPPVQEATWCPLSLLTLSPGKAAAAGECYIACATAQREWGTVSPPRWLLAWQQPPWGWYTCLTADADTGRAPANHPHCESWLQWACKECRLHRVPNTELLLHIKNNHSRCAREVLQ